MLIGCSYFTAGPRQILNVSLGNNVLSPDGRAANAAVEAYIAEYQEEFLYQALGQRFDVSTEAYATVCEKLKDAFADYVFFHFLRDSGTQATLTGLVVRKNDNRPVAPISRQVHTWNGMVKKLERFAAWCATDECPFEDIAVSKNLLTPINVLNI